MSAEIFDNLLGTVSRIVLQWGRALMSAEMPWTWAIRRPRASLQWGRALMSAEMVTWIA